MTKTSPASSTPVLLKGTLVTCDPDASHPRVLVKKDQVIAVDKTGVIVFVGERSALPREYQGWGLRDYGKRLILPGFVDTHIHFPQMDLIGCYSGALLEWLSDHTFPHEIEFAKSDKKLKVSAQIFIDTLLQHGTTCAVIMSDSQVVTTEALLREVDQRGFRAIVGKLSMDRNAPPELLVDMTRDLEEQRRLIKAWHQRDDGRIRYAISPRFAPSCTDQLLDQLGGLVQEFEDLFVQTHFAENLDEISWVKQLFPNHPDYLSVYDHYGLLSDRTILAHCIHLSEKERQLLGERDCRVSHCPSSNLFLGSGLCSISRFTQSGVSVSLGTDIGAGTSFSLWQTMNECHKVARLRGEDIKPSQLFYMATLGGARALHASKPFGAIAEGYQADLQILNPDNSTLLRRRLNELEDSEQVLFALIHHANPNLLEAVYIAGRTLLPAS